jgi:hypothetical protein
VVQSNFVLNSGNVFVKQIWVVVVMHRHLLIVVVVVQSILAQQEDIDWAFLVSLLSVSLAFKVPTNQMLAQMYVTVVHLTHTKTKLAVLLVKSVGVLRRVVGQVVEVLLHVLVMPRHHRQILVLFVVQENSNQAKVEAFV